MVIWGENEVNLSVAPGDLMEALIPFQVSLDCIYLWLVEQQNLNIHRNPASCLSLFVWVTVSVTHSLSVSKREFTCVCVCVLKKCNYTDIQTFYSCKDIHWHYTFTTSLLLTFTLRTQCFIQTCTMLSFLADLGSNLSLTGSFNPFELVSKI